MSIQHVDTAPETEDFTPLKEHEERTPTTFFDAKPVLYAHYSGLTLSTPSSALEQDAVFNKFTRAIDGDDALIKDVTIFVSSENLVFFQTTPSPTGVAIPYPAVALHATMKYKKTVDAVYMNISLNDADTVNDEEDIQTLELTVLPPSYTENATNTCILDIFNAMNICADLHPDQDGSDEGGEDVFDETAPGATGWITADNMDEYMDEEGNFSGMVIGDELGPGAGTVRTRDDAEGTNGINGSDEHEGKYYRTG